MNHPSPISYEDRAKARAKEIRLRLMGPQKRVNLFQKPETAVEADLPIVLEPKAEKPTPFVPPFFNTSCSQQIVWKGHYSAYSGGGVVLGHDRSMREIALSVLKNYPDITLEDIKSPSRTRPIAWARHHIVHAIKMERPTFSFPQIGRFLGGRDHTTSLNSFRKYKQFLDENKETGE